MTLLWRLLQTRDDYAILALRLVLGLVILPHGAQKVLAWFGGGGIGGTMAYFSSLGIPAPLGALAILAESVGALLLVIGLAGRVAAFGVGAVMLTAAILVHRPYGFFVNWFGTQPGEGFEYHLLALGIAAAILIKGSGAYSLDRMLVQSNGVVRSPTHQSVAQQE